MSRLMLIVVILVLITNQSSWADGPPSFMGLGDLPGGGTASAAHGVSADGTVVVVAVPRRQVQSRFAGHRVAAWSVWVACQAASLTVWQTVPPATALSSLGAEQTTRRVQRLFAGQQVVECSA